MGVPSEFITDYRSHLSWVIRKLVRQDALDYVYSTAAHGTCPDDLQDKLYDAIVADVDANLIVDFRPQEDNENTDRFHEVTCPDGTTSVWPKVWGET
jgi:hypothetical protein